MRFAATFFAYINADSRTPSACENSKLSRPRDILVLGNARFFRTRKLNLRVSSLFTFYLPEIPMLRIALCGLVEKLV